MKRFLPELFKSGVRRADDINTGLQPFKLVKYFSYTSLVVILAASFA